MPSRAPDQRRKQESPQPGRPPGWWRRGRMVAAVSAAAALAIVFAYSGASAGLVLYRLLVDGLFLLAWLLSATGLGAGLMPALVRERSHVGVRLVTFAAGGLGVLSLCILGLGLVGMLGRVTAYLLLLPGFALGPLALRTYLREG